MTMMTKVTDYDDNNQNDDNVDDLGDQPNEQRCCKGRRVSRHEGTSTGSISTLSSCY